MADTATALQNEGMVSVSEAHEKPEQVGSICKAHPNVHLFFFDPLKFIVPTSEGARQRCAFICLPRNKSACALVLESGKSASRAGKHQPDAARGLPHYADVHATPVMPCAKRHFVAPLPLWAGGAAHLAHARMRHRSFERRACQKLLQAMMPPKVRVVGSGCW